MRNAHRRPPRRHPRRARSWQSATEGVEVVFHLAALIAIPYSYVAAESFIDTNVTRHAQRARGEPACRRRAVRPHLDQRGLRHARRRCRSPRRTRSTPSRRTPPRRSRPTSSPSPSMRSYGLPVIVLRPFNTYGPRQSQRAVLPTMLRQLLAGRHEIQLGPPRPAARPDLRRGHRRRLRARGARPPGIEGRDDPARDRAQRVDRRPVRPRLPAARRRGDGRSRTPARVRPDACEVMVLARTPAARGSSSAGRRDVARGRLAQTIDWLRAHPEPATTSSRDAHASETMPRQAATADPARGTDRSAATRARYLAECLETNFVSSVGPFVGRFEREFADAVGVALRRRLLERDRRAPPRLPRAWTSVRATRCSSRR